MWEFVSLWFSVQSGPGEPQRAWKQMWVRVDTDAHKGVPKHHELDQSPMG